MKSFQCWKDINGDIIFCEKDKVHLVLDPSDSPYFPVYEILVKDMESAMDYHRKFIADYHENLKQ